MFYLVILSLFRIILCLYLTVFLFLVIPSYGFISRILSL